MGGEQTDASCRRAVGYGPEVWHTLAGVGWLYWDLWFCVVCVADHGGDWDALDTAIYQSDRHHREEKWSHLLDLLHLGNGSYAERFGDLRFHVRRLEWRRLLGYEYLPGDVASDHGLGPAEEVIPWSTWCTRSYARTV